MIFLTYNDAPGGIYYGQVIDVCKYWEEAFNEKVTLVAFISLRNYYVDKAKIRAFYPNSVVLPMIPGIDNWRRNMFRLKLFMLFRRKQKVIARGVFSTLLAIESKKFEKVCFDARGAYEAEWSEYMQKDSPTLTAQMKDLEKEALLKSDFRIAVSNKLVDYWKERYNYTGNAHVVIPCTLPSTHTLETDKDPGNTIRKNLGIADNEVLLVYSGSSAQWQSFSKLEENITTAFTQNSNLKLLMLCKPGGEGSLAKKFPGRVMQTWLKFPEEVEEFLQAADYGLLVREPSVTNKVSSPVKFAEYLAAGLPVIISEGIGDYSSFVKEKNCGMLVESANWSALARVPENEKLRMQEVAKTFFTKPVYRKEYDSIRTM